MYKNIGNKIKGLAIAIAVLGTIIGVIYLFMSIGAYAENKDYIGYAKSGGLINSDILREAGDKALAGLYGIYISIPLIIFSLLATLPLFGFGHMIENSDKALLLQEENSKLLKSLSTSIDKKN